MKERERGKGKLEEREGRGEEEGEEMRIDRKSERKNGARKRRGERRM